MNFWLCVAALACLAAFDCHWLPAGVELGQIYLTVGQSQGRVRAESGQQLGCVDSTC